MAKTFAQCAAQLGTVNHNGQELALTQLPYITGTHANPVYRASAMDENGGEYQAEWVALVESDDESDACDWANPAKIEAI